MEVCEFGLFYLNRDLGDVRIIGLVSFYDFLMLNIGFFQSCLIVHEIAEQLRFQDVSLIKC